MAIAKIFPFSISQQLFLKKENVSNGVPLTPVPKPEDRAITDLEHLVSELMNFTD